MFLEGNINALLVETLLFFLLHILAFGAYFGIFRKYYIRKCCDISSSYIYIVDFNVLQYLIAILLRDFHQHGKSLDCLLRIEHTLLYFRCLLKKDEDNVGCGMGGGGRKESLSDHILCC
jgi:hypothetical protein